MNEELTSKIRVGGVECEGVCEGGEVEDALTVEGETGDCCVVEGEGASSEEEEGVVIDDEDEVAPVMVVVLRLREGELLERWKRMGAMGFEELWAMVRAETVREP
ncbi:uncharacterized protein MONOS_18005 [Monocercomonoides exilis]|uniref:uncharacterized protein n=1 Tax=Monocercomonoides exilis TaxID=2049356 RepID=UPI003559BB15|nr:hypothetical protein MONOS_18005 [Monocercomonoides exilis]